MDIYHQSLWFCNSEARLNYMREVLHLSWVGSRIHICLIFLGKVAKCAELARLEGAWPLRKCVCILITHEVTVTLGEYFNLLLEVCNQVPGEVALNYQPE